MDYPRLPNKSTEVVFSKEPTTWATFNGLQVSKWIFEPIHMRNLEDSYTNIHNPILTALFLCNNNVICSITGASVMYVTGYNHKPNQKEERLAFENVARVLLKNIAHQEVGTESEPLLPSQVGFRRLLLAVYVHTHSLVIAAPMAHYLALNGSRFRFSHPMKHFPMKSLYKIMNGESVTMRITQAGSKTVPYCRALDYLHRPPLEPFESMGPYEFFLKTEVVDRFDSRYRNKSVAFKFDEQHPKKKTSRVVSTSRNYVLRMDWTFFKNAKQLSCDIKTIRRANPNQIDEEFCKRVLCCFAPYRKLEDLCFRGSFQSKFARLYAEGFLEHAEIILQNAQDIRNSLDAGRLNSHCSTEKNIFDEEIDDSSEDEDNTALYKNMENTLVKWFESQQGESDHLTKVFSMFL